MGKYTEYDKAALSAGWRAVLVTVAVLVVCGGLGWAGWAIKVATSDVKGAGDAQVKINSAENRIQSQELEEGIFFFTTSGVMVTYSGEYIVTDAPLKLEVKQLG